MTKKILVIQVAALGWDFLQKNINKLKLNWQRAETVEPAVTCTVQASFKTATNACNHGMVANGFFFDEMHKPLFWEQNGNLVEGPRVWDNWQADGKKVGIMFWQQSLSSRPDLLISPAPIHKHHGGMIQDCYDLPRGLYGRLKKECGGFNLMNYWGPMTSKKATEWIVKSTTQVMRDEQPELLLTYLPHLDYELQKSGPDSKKSQKEFVQLERMLGELIAGCEENGYDYIVYGDYAIMNVDQPILPNRILRDHGHLGFRDIKGMLYPDYYNSDALAIADHQVAHIKLFDPTQKEKIMKLFKSVDGIAEVIDGRTSNEFGGGHRRSGDIILKAAPNAWFSYQWWHKKSEAPDYATHVDIHNKPGFDPCELFFGFPFPFATSTNNDLVKGSHGLGGPDYPIAWATSLPIEKTIHSILDLAEFVKTLGAGK